MSEQICCIPSCPSHPEAPANFDSEENEITYLPVPSLGDSMRNQWILVMNNGDKDGPNGTEPGAQICSRHFISVPMDLSVKSTVPSSSYTTFATTPSIFPWLQGWPYGDYKNLLSMRSIDVSCFDSPVPLQQRLSEYFPETSSFQHEKRSHEGMDASSTLEGADLSQQDEEESAGVNPSQNRSVLVALRRHVPPPLNPGTSSSSEGEELPEGARGTPTNPQQSTPVVRSSLFSPPATFCTCSSSDEEEASREVIEAVNNPQQHQQRPARVAFRRRPVVSVPVNPGTNSSSDENES